MINSVSTITNTYGTNVYTKPLVTKANISPAFEGKRKTQNSENLYNFSSFLHGTAMLSDKIKIEILHYAQNDTGIQKMSP